MPPTNWLVSQAEHCARATPECFEENPSAIHIFMNGSRSFSGVTKLSKATLTWGDNVQQPVNACVETIPPRLTDEDIGITPEQWARRVRFGAAARANASFRFRAAHCAPCAPLTRARARRAAPAASSRT